MKPQQGMVLILVLTLLLALTILGVSSISNSTLEIRMARNFQDRNAAFQAAEAALREGERLVQNSDYNGTEFDNLCTSGLCQCSKSSSCDYNGDNTQTFWELDTVWNTSGKHMTYSTYSMSGLVSPAKYIIEHMGWVCSTDADCDSSLGEPLMFRVTAVGYGASNTSKVTLQSTYLKR